MAEAVPRGSGTLLPGGGEGWPASPVPSSVSCPCHLEEQTCSHRLPVWRGSGGRLHALTGAAGSKWFSFIYKKPKTLSKRRRISSGEGWWPQTPKCAARPVEEERGSSQPLASRLKPVPEPRLCKGLIHASPQGQAQGILHRDEIVGYWGKCKCFNTVLELRSQTPLLITVGISVHFAGSACGVSQRLAP